MGLAAAQARLLTITARKADCEFQSMTLSHEKIALARDLQNLSDEYQNALSTTKLSYDYYGTKAGGVDLSYGFLMKPSMYNEYYPKLITDTKNRVILNQSIANAALQAGIPFEGLGCTPSKDIRDEFIRALCGENIITANKASIIQASDYNNGIGLGWTQSAERKTRTVTYDKLVDIIKLRCEDADTETMSQAWSTTNDANYTVLPTLIVYDETTSKKFDYSLNSNTDNKYPCTDSFSISLADLLAGSGDYILGYTSEHDAGASDALLHLQTAMVGNGNPTGSFLQWMLDQFDSLLGTEEGNTQSDLALEYAMTTVYNQLCPNTLLVDAKIPQTQKGTGNDPKEYDPNEFRDTGDHTYNNIDKYYQNLGFSNDFSWNGNAKSDEQIKNADITVFTNWVKKDKDKKISKKWKEHSGSKFWYEDNMGNQIDDFTSYMIGSFRYTKYCKDKKQEKGKADRASSVAAIDLSNVAQVFLSAYIDCMEGNLDNVYYLRKNDNTYNDFSTYKFEVNDGYETDETDCLEAQFYDALFNMICNNGWVLNEQIDNSDYMQELLKSGSAFISSISSDGYFYRGQYSTDKYIYEEADTEAIALAEARYNTAKAKLQTKEDKIDMKMKNLDTEISSLSSEYDSVKKILQSNTEKSFSRYN